MNILMREGIIMKKINEEWLDDHIIELKNIYEVLMKDSTEFLKQEKIWKHKMRAKLDIKDDEFFRVPINQLDRVEFDDNHLQFENEMKKYDIDMIRVIQSLFWVGRQVWEEAKKKWLQNHQHLFG